MNGLVRKSDVLKVICQSLLSTKYDELTMKTCSECGNTEVLHKANFCPNCGADMRGDADGL